MYKKILAGVLFGMILITGIGCQGSGRKETEHVSEQEIGPAAGESRPQEETAALDETAEEAGNRDSQEETPKLDEEYQLADMQQEQEAGAAQLEADAIDMQHEKKEIPEESVPRTVFGESALKLDESLNWICTYSEKQEDGSFGEVYACEEGLEYEWKYVPAEETDADSGLQAALSQEGWSVSGTERNDTLSGALGCEVYDYTAYEDDNGYSMMHQGLYLNIEGGYYTADFSMMEGSMGMYYDRVETLLSQIYIE